MDADAATADEDDVCLPRRWPARLPTVGANTTTFTWDIAGGLPVVLDDGNQYVYGAGLVSMRQSGNWYYYLADGLGSTMAVVDSSGNSQKAYEYDVYGEVTGGSGSLANEFDFAGQQTDGTRLQYLRARYYDPGTGTFLSREPLARLPWWTGQSLAYSYANPATRSDPTGLDSPISVWDCRKLGPVAGRICGEAQQASQTLTELVGDLDDIALSALTGLTGEYLKDFRAGCAADKGLCAVYFTELFVAWYVGQIFALAVGTVGCGGTAGVGCGVLALSAAVHTYLFKVLTAETKQRIVERGQFERRRDKLLENQRHARCVLSGEC